MHIVATSSLMIGALLFCGRSEATRIFKVDAVELIAGNEVNGEPKFSTEHGRYKYQFSTKANLDAFVADPEKYEIQLGGACARMGPLTGEGTTELFGVHDRKIYLFASEACRKRFMSAPGDFLDRPDQRVIADADALRRGRELIDLAVNGVGGEKALASLVSLQASATSTTTHSGKDYVNRKKWTIVFPSRFRIDDDWNESRWAAVITENDAFFASDEVWSMHRQQRAALERELFHDPVVILKARSRVGFVASGAGRGIINDRAVEYVDVWFAAVATRLAIDVENGRVISAAFRGRGANMTIGDVVRTFADHQTSDGITLPLSYAVQFNGKAADGLARKYDKLELNINVDPAVFERSK